MGYKSKLVKIALNKSPKRVILWLANKKLEGIAELTDFCFDSDEEKIYTQLLLAGEDAPVDVWLEDFTLIADDEQNLIIIHQAKSSRQWVDSLLSKVVLNREWKIPNSQLDLVRELFDSDCSEEEGG